MISAPQGGLCDSSSSGDATLPVGGKAALPVQQQVASSETVPEGAYPPLPPAAAAADNTSLTAVPGAETGTVRLRYDRPC